MRPSHNSFTCTCCMFRVIFIFSLIIVLLPIKLSSQYLPFIKTPTNMTKILILESCSKWLTINYNVFLHFIRINRFHDLQLFLPNCTMFTYENFEEIIGNLNPKELKWFARNFLFLQSEYGLRLMVHCQSCLTNFKIESSPNTSYPKIVFQLHQNSN